MRDKLTDIPVEAYNKNWLEKKSVAPDSEEGKYRAYMDALAAYAEKVPGPSLESRFRDRPKFFHEAELEIDRRILNEELKKIESAEHVNADALLKIQLIAFGGKKVEEVLNDEEKKELKKAFSSPKGKVFTAVAKVLNRALTRINSVLKTPGIASAAQRLSDAVKPKTAEYKSEQGLFKQSIRRARNL